MFLMLLYISIGFRCLFFRIDMYVDIRIYSGFIFVRLFLVDYMRVNVGILL